MFLTGKNLVIVDLFLEIFVNNSCFRDLTLLATSCIRHFVQRAVSRCRFLSSSGTYHSQKRNSYRQAFYFRNDKLLKDHMFTRKRRHLEFDCARSLSRDFEKLKNNNLSLKFAGLPNHFPLLTMAGGVVGKNCPVPSDIAGHKGVNAKGGRGITSKESEFVSSTTRRLIPFGTHNRLCKLLNSDYEWI